MSATPDAPTGRGWAYLGAILGGALSVAANVAHSYIAGDPSALKIVFSVGWPVLLFVGIEVLARVAFPEGHGYATLRFGGVGLVALVAAVVSYRHLSALFEHWGEDPVTVIVGPLAIDGLLGVCSAALILTAKRVARMATAPAAVPARVEAPAPAVVERPTLAVPPAVVVAEAPAVEAPHTDTPAPAEAATEAQAPSVPDIFTTSVVIPTAPAGRTAEQTAALYAALKAERPDRTQENIATMLTMSRRTLRDKLAAAAPKRPATRPALRIVSPAPAGA